MDSSRQSGGSWREAWITRRNQLLSSPKFQRFAARFPLMRPVARRRARVLFDLVAGFTYSQVLAACIELGLLEKLARGSRPIDALAGEIGLSAEATERLLRAAAALGLAEPLGDRWALGRAGAELLGNPGIADMVAHHRLLYADLADPVALLRRGGGGGELSKLWPYAESEGTGDPAHVAAYSALMAASQPLVAEQAIDSYPFDRHRKLLDVGGGEGVFLAALARHFPRLGLGLFDLPAVTDRAQANLARQGLLSRVGLHPGSFLSDPLPGGYDIITLVRVLHDHDNDRVMELLRNIHAALPVGGALFIAEPMAGTPGAEPAGDAYFGFYLLAMGSGRPRRPDEIETMLKGAGFSKARTLRTALPITVRSIVASK